MKLTGLRSADLVSSLEGLSLLECNVVPLLFRSLLLNPALAFLRFRRLSR